MLAMLAAMKAEISGLKRHMIIQDAVAENGYQLFRGKYQDREALLVQTGMGRERVERAVRFVLERYPVSALISFGFAGALTAESRVGDVIACSELCCGDGQPDTPYHSDATLVSQSLQVLVGGVTRQGKSVTVVQPVYKPEAKQALAEAFHSDIVDMESYWVARIARERQVPFLAIRVVSDTLKDRLPPFDEMLDSEGKLSRQKTAIYFLSHPQQLRRLFSLYRNIRRAEVNLTGFLDRLAERL